MTTKNQAPARPTPLRPLARAAWLCLCSAPALAQNTPAAAPEKPEEIVVTGSRIRGIAPAGSNVVPVTRDNIETSGAVSTTQILQQVPQVFNLGVSENSRGQSGGAGNITYGSSVNLRGIGPFATLGLINGHRVVLQGTGGTSLDPSVIPTLALERVEIVADGASAIYGSDAVAGVVNLIMRRNEKGAQAFARYGQGQSYDERQIGGLWATRWKDGQVTLTFENEYHSALSGRDRDFFTGNLLSQGGGDFRSTQCNPGNITISGVSYAIPATGVTTATAGQLVAGTSNKCDNQKVQDLVPKQNRDSLAFTYNQALPAGIEFYADGFATRREYTFRPAALFSTLTVPGTNAFYVRPPTAPTGTSETVAYSFINELPVNIAEGYSKSAEATVGADVAVGAGWKVGILATYGYNDDLSITSRGLNTPAITAALASSNPATALNVFGSAPNSQAVLSTLNNTIAYSPGTTHFQNLQFKGDGPLFALPGGLVRAAAGYELQKVKTEGGQTTGPPTAIITGTVTLMRKIDSVYGELQVPIIGTANALPGVNRLDLALAARTDRYDDVGSTHNPKFGLSWVPVNGVTVKASYGTSFRAPGLTQIRGFTNGGRGGLFVQNYSDPTNGGALRVGVALSAANPDLKPETATTKTLGIDWAPAIGNNTKLSLSYFDIVYDNQITAYLSDLTVLNREAAFAGTPVIQRNPSAALQAQLLATYPINNIPPANWTLFIDGRNFNLAKSVSRGFDFQASTRIATEHMGSFGLGLSGTVFTAYDVALTPAGALTSQLNAIYNPMRFKARGSLSWAYNDFYANLYINHVNAYKNNLANPEQQVAATTTFDVRLAYTLDTSGWFKDTTLALGAVNLFDKKPPFVNVAQSNNGGGGFDPTQTSPVGRVVSVSLDKKF